MGWVMSDPSRLLRQIECADARSLRDAYEHAADVTWVDGCSVDFANLVLELRMTAPWHARSAVEARLAQIERIALGLGR